MGSLAGRSNRFLAPPTSALLFQRRERSTAYRFPRRSRGRHRISVRPLLPHRPHLPAHTDGKFCHTARTHNTSVPLSSARAAPTSCIQQAHKSTGKSGTMNVSTCRQSVVRNTRCLRRRARRPNTLAQHLMPESKRESLLRSYEAGLAKIYWVSIIVDIRLRRDQGNDFPSASKTHVKQTAVLR